MAYTRVLHDKKQDLAHSHADILLFSDIKMSVVYNWLQH